MNLRPVRLSALIIVAMTSVIVNSATAGSPEFLVISGSAEGDWNTAQFPKQSFDVPLTGTLLVTSQGTKQVRITGSYQYEAQIEWVCFFAFCPSNILFPYPFEVEASVDLVAVVGVENGNTVYRAPQGTVVSDWWLGALGFSYTVSERQTLPDIVLSRGRFGFGGDWYTNGPLVTGSNAAPTELFFEGSL